MSQKSIYRRSLAPFSNIFQELMDQRLRVVNPSILQLFEARFAEGDHSNSLVSRDNAKGANDLNAHAASSFPSFKIVDDQRQPSRRGQFNRFLLAHTRRRGRQAKVTEAEILWT